MRRRPADQTAAMADRAHQAQPRAARRSPARGPAGPQSPSPPPAVPGIPGPRQQGATHHSHQAAPGHAERAGMLGSRRATPATRWATSDAGNRSPSRPQPAVGQQRPGVSRRHQQAQQRARHRNRVGNDLLVGVDQRGRPASGAISIAWEKNWQCSRPACGEAMAETHRRQQSRAADLPPIERGQSRRRRAVRPASAESRIRARAGPPRGAGPASRRPARGRTAAAAGRPRRPRPRADRPAMPSQPIDAQIDQAADARAQDEQRRQPDIHRHGEDSVHAIFSRRGPAEPGEDFRGQLLGRFALGIDLQVGRLR